MSGLEIRPGSQNLILVEPFYMFKAGPTLKPFVALFGGVSKVGDRRDKKWALPDDDDSNERAGSGVEDSAEANGARL